MTSPRLSCVTEQNGITAQTRALQGDHPGFDEARAAAAAIAEATGVAEHRIAVVLGSGWGGAAELIGETAHTVPLADVPGFHAPKVPGHNAVIRSVRLPDGTHALVFGSRTHFYESRDAQAVAHTVRTAAAAGAKTVVLTNGCGGLDPEIAPGTPVLISDHVNLTGATFMVREVVAKMVQTDQRPGVIVNMSSIARHGNRGQSNYVSAKAALAANTFTWAREFASLGIRVGAVAPGMVETPMTQGMNQKARDALVANIPVGRIGLPEDLWLAVKFVLECDYFNGRTIDVDGGLTM